MALNNPNIVYDIISIWRFNIFFLITGSPNAQIIAKAALIVLIVPPVDDEVNYGIIHKHDA